MSVMIPFGGGGGASENWQKIRNDGSTTRVVADPYDALGYMAAFTKNYGGYQSFNAHVRISDYATNCVRMFENCTGLNSEIIIGNNVTNCYGMFSNCQNFNQPISIPDSVTQMLDMFNYCRNFNQDLYVYNNVNSYRILNHIFNYTDKFMSNLYIGYNATANAVIRVGNPYVGEMMNDSNKFTVHLGGINSHARYELSSVVGSSDAQFKAIFYSSCNYVFGTAGSIFFPTNYNQDVILRGNVWTNTELPSNYMYCVFPNNFSYNWRERKVIFDCNIMTGNSTMGGIGRFFQLNLVQNTQNNYRYTSYNYKTYIGDNMVNASYLFANHIYFNNSVIFENGNSLTDCSFMLHNCRYFNQPVTIPPNVENCSAMFYHCIRMTQPVIFSGNKVKDCDYMFFNCGNFNHPISIPDNVTNLRQMFYQCTNFNQSITIPNGAIDCSLMFYSASKFNRPINIPNGVQNCWQMFYGIAYHQDITFPRSVKNIARVFTDFAGNLYIDNDSINAYDILVSPNSTYMKNIYCNNIEVLNKTAASQSITGTAITWTAVPNGYYNASYNLYIYNNYTPAT